ncbi:MAG: DivIVA domain-containing protein, partial [Acutalibacteraceae bacterium]
MLSAAEIRNVKFSKSMSGYKQEEVDVLLDRIEADYAQFDRAVKEYRAKIEAMNKEIESLKSSQNSIQNVLVSAQKLADQIVDEAKQKSEQIVKNAETNLEVITAREKELATAFELKAQERKAKLEKELEDMVKTARIKADSMKAAAEDSVARQQLLYDKLKMEM